ncbi:MAG TPA: secretin N-terminal domain-containing protein, partial [Humisphaera sp.]|nr:secretin N-terminal domain-containing protein [Humisphaera sp.]
MPAMLLAGSVAVAQTTREIAPPPPVSGSPATAPAAESLVSLNLPENAPLKVLIDYVSQEFGVSILYDEQLGNQRLTIVAPAKLPRSAIPALLDSALRMKGLALVDAGQPGWKRVVALGQAARMPGAEAPGAEKPAVVTQVFKLKYADATKLDTIVKPFLTQPGATSFPLAGQELLVVTDYAANLKRVADLVQSIDQPNEETTIEFFPVKHADPARLTQQLDQLLKAKLHSEGGDDRLANTVETAYDVRTNQVVVIAAKSRMADARDVVKALDTVIPEEQSPVRFYKLANATAADVLTTIRSLEGEQESPAPAGGTTQRNTRPGAAGKQNSPSQTLSQPNVPDLGSRSSSGFGAGGGPGSGAGRASADRSMAATGGTTTGGSGGETARAAIPSGATDPLSALRDSGKSRQGKVTADPNTNSIIVIAPPDVQRLYEQLIRTLDKRRPQVLIECTIVTLDTTDNFQLGVEIGQAAGSKRNQTITFSSFGLSTPDPTTGQLSIIPGLGFNGALISTDVANVVVRALQQNTRARVSSAPRILVNDNNLGTLSSLSEFPYASVNASQTVATTSFGDYAQAGTEITVTPHISESDYLQLEYSVLLSSFTGPPITQAGTTLPPPRKSDSVQSQVTIPDGSTIVVGGLNAHNFTESVDAVPFVGDIPLLKYLFSNRTKLSSTST